MNKDTAYNFAYTMQRKYSRVVKKKQATGNGHFLCNICGNYFETDVLLNNHLTVMHRPLTINIKYGAYCNTCHQILAEKIINNHVPCSKIETWRTPIFKKKLDCINKKRKDNSIPYTCCVCCKEFASNDELFTHSKLLHRPLTINFENNSNFAFCNTCEMFYREGIFFDHFPCNAVDIRCFFCLTTMPLKTHFSIHNLNYHSFRKFQCNLCEIDTKEMTFSELDKHMKMHSKTDCGLYKCVKCNLFMEKSTLARHADYYHRGCRCLNETCYCDRFNEDFYITKILKDDIVSSDENISTDLTDPTSNHYFPDVDCNLAFEDGSSTNTREKMKINNISTSSEVQPELKDTFLNNDEPENKIDINIPDFENNTRRLLSEHYQQIISNIKSESDQDDSIPFSENNQERNIEFVNVKQKIQVFSRAVDNGNLSNSEQEKSNSSQAKKKKIMKNTPKRKSRVIMCAVCGLIFKSESELNYHGDIYHRPWATEMLKDFFCVLCKSFFDNVDVYQSHHPCKTEPVMNRCHICNMRLPFREHFLLHNVKIIAYMNLICLLCENNSTKYNVRELNIHRQTDHNKNGVYECLKCDVTFEKCVDLKRHLVKSCPFDDTTAMAEKYKLKADDNSLPEYKECKECNEVFFTHNKIEQHMKKHNAEIRLCFICGQTFKKCSDYLGHINFHLKTNSYDCSSCDKKFYKQKHLRQHQKIHENNKKFPCHFCPKTFVQQTSLIYHMAVHTKENVFICSVCGKKWDTQRKLTSHMELHTADGTNPHKCLVCNKYFTHKCNLLVHMRTHTDPDAEANK